MVETSDHLNNLPKSDIQFFQFCYKRVLLCIVVINVIN